VFDITKRKIHNVLQGVAKDGVEMTDEDKKWFELWTEQNCEYRLDTACLDNAQHYCSSRRVVLESGCYRGGFDCH
jgi:hypothetical protein